MTCSYRTNKDVFVMQDKLRWSSIKEKGGRGEEKWPLDEAAEAGRWAAWARGGWQGHGDVAPLLCVCGWGVRPLAHRQGASVPGQSTVQGLHPLQVEPCRDRLVQTRTRSGCIRWDTGRDILGSAVAWWVLGMCQTLVWSLEVETGRPSVLKGIFIPITLPQNVLTCYFCSLVGNCNNIWF